MKENKAIEPGISWFEIAVSDFERAKKFYESIFNEHMMVMDLGVLKMAIFQRMDGAICHNPNWYKPSIDGTLIYMNADPDLSIIQSRIEPSGGTLIQTKKLIAPGRGYMCLFTDSEGNRLALHSYS